MPQYLNAVTSEADTFGELLARPGCYEFEPFDGSPRRVLSSHLSPPTSIEGTVSAHELHSEILTDGLVLPEEENISDLLKEFGSLTFRRLAVEAHNQGHKLLGGIATYETNRGPQAGLFVSRRILLEMSFAAMNAAIAPNAYPRYDIPPHPEYGRHAPPEVRSLARQIPKDDQEKIKHISYSLTRESIAGALRSAVEKRNIKPETVLYLVPSSEPDPIAA